MKKVFVFKPSESWAYCGGGLVIVADSFEECQKLFNEECQRTFNKGKIYKTEEDTKKDNDICDIWVLVEILSCLDEEKSRVVFYDYHWA